MLSQHCNLSVVLHCHTQLIQRAPRLQASGLALSAWVYAHLRHGHSDLFSALSARAVQLAAEDRLVPKDARQLLYAAAKLGVRDRALMKACGKVRAWDLGASGGGCMSHVVRRPTGTASSLTSPSCVKPTGRFMPTLTNRPSC